MSNLLKSIPNKLPRDCMLQGYMFASLMKEAAAGTRSSHHRLSSETVESCLFVQSADAVFTFNDQDSCFWLSRDTDLSEIGRVLPRPCSIRCRRLWILEPTLLFGRCPADMINVSGYPVLCCLASLIFFSVDLLCDQALCFANVSSTFEHLLRLRSLELSKHIGWAWLGLSYSCVVYHFCGL